MTHFVQIDDQIREATDDEIIAIEARQTEIAALEQAKADQEIARQNVLTKLGLTADELKALLG